MPPPSTSSRNNSKKDINSKGKQREVVMEENIDDDNDSNEQQTTTADDHDLHPFLTAQIKLLDTPLVAPNKKDDLACTSEEYKSINKAVRAINTTLSAKRNRRLDKSTIQAVSEQIEYLQENTRGKQMVVRLDENSRLFVDRDDWLEDLPPQWPSNTEADPAIEGGEELEIDDKELQQYIKLYASVQALRQSRHVLKQKSDHYEQLESILLSTKVDS